MSSDRPGRTTVVEFFYRYDTLKDTQARRRLVLSLKDSIEGNREEGWEILSRLEAAPDPGTRINVASVARFLGTARAEDVLLRLLRDEDPQVREVAAAGLGSEAILHPGLAPELAEAMRREEDSDTKEELFQALARIDHGLAAEFVDRVADDSENSQAVRDWLDRRLGAS